MTEQNQATASDAKTETKTETVDNSKEMNFRRLEKLMLEEREARIRAEEQAKYAKEQMESLARSQQKPEPDPFDDINEDIYNDPKLLKTKIEQKLAKQSQQITDTAVEKALQKVKQEQQEAEKRNFMPRLKAEFPDFDAVMNEANVAAMEQTNPEFVQSLLHINDDYERRKLAYNYLKRNQKAPANEEIQKKVEQNQTNPHFIPGAHGTPGAVDFDIRSESARQAAYAKLKAAQRRPIGR